MSGSLAVLIVDDRPETVRPLAEFLTQRCRHVEVASSAKEAQAAITRRKAAGEAYQLIISDFVMPGTDGLSFLRELRLRSDTTPVVIITGYRALNPVLEVEAKRLGVLAILDKPIQLEEVARLVEQATGALKRQEQGRDQPFFGTSRIVRRSDPMPRDTPQEPSAALEPRQTSTSPPESVAMPGTASWSAHSGALEPRVPEALQPQPAASPVEVPVPHQHRPSAIIHVGSPTTRFRRSASSPGTPMPGTGRVTSEATPQPPTSFTARERRGVDGTDVYSKPPRTESGRQVACTRCARTFLVLAKPEAFTTVCVHCGQMQRIEPAS
jgi:CheY-like chemotaxis protein